jgi:hypothetical protein
MREINLGIRLGIGEGISFFGIEEVNQAIGGGEVVVSVKAGEALLEKVSEEEGESQFALAGCNIVVRLEAAAAEAPTGRD